MKGINKIIRIATIALLFGACGAEMAKEEIHEMPEFTAGYYQGILGALNDRIENAPENADAYFKKAEVLERLQNPDNAIINYKKAIKLDSLNPTYFKSLASLFMRQGKWKRAEENALKAAQLGDQTAELHELLAHIYIHEGAFTIGLNYLNKAIETAPRNSAYTFRKGKLFMHMGDTARAKTFLLENLDRIEPDTEVYEALADIFTSEKRYPEAVAYLDSSLLLADKAANPLIIKKAAVLQKSGQIPAAKMLVNEYLKKDSTNFALNYKLAELHFDSYGYDSTLYYLNNAILINSKSKESYLLMGKVYDRKRMYYSAQDQFKNALLIDTSYQQAKEALDELDRKLAYIYRKKKEEEKISKLPQLETVKPVLPE